MLAYYPQTFDIARIAREYPDLEIVNEDEEERLQDVLERKKRGKGAPKKAKSKGISGTSFLVLSVNLFASLEDSRRLGKKR